MSELEYLRNRERLLEEQLALNIRLRDRAIQNHIASIGGDAPTRAAIVLLVTPAGHVWLAKRKNTKVMPYEWECPAGKCEKDESFIEAAQREVEEETGLLIESWRFIPYGLLRHRATGAMDVACALYMVRLTPDEFKLRHTEPDKRSIWVLVGPEEHLECDEPTTTGTLALLNALVVDTKLLEGQ